MSPSPNHATEGLGGFAGFGVKEGHSGRTKDEVTLREKLSTCPDALPIAAKLQLPYFNKSMLLDRRENHELGPFAAEATFGDSGIYCNDVGPSPTVGIAGLRIVCRGS
jgi:hypothetical protein